MYVSVYVCEGLGQVFTAPRIETLSLLITAANAILQFVNSQNERQG